ncbi:MAG TPA: LPS export ABC transporter periplasmic protein LptC [Thioalkalivibrio sp.]|nr:LPS export ABC transporter periplasmic protein LptC [Thioalkalivibrio sp.]
MIMRRATLILLLALVAMSHWWIQRQLDEHPEIAQVLYPEAREGRARDADIRITLKDDEADYPLDRDDKARLLSDGHSELIAPVIHMHEANLPPLRIESETGWITQGRDEVRLLGHVTIDRPATHPDGPLRLVTSDLTVFPQARRAETAAHAIATAPGYRIEGVGMRMDLNEQTLLLLSEVKGRYEP